MPDKASKRVMAPKDEGMIDYEKSPPAHAYGEGGPERMSGHEGPDNLPELKIKKEKE